MLQEISRTDPELFRPVGMARPLVRPGHPRSSGPPRSAWWRPTSPFVLGWRHRVSGPLFAALLLWTISYRNSWSMVFHSDNVLVLHAAALASPPPPTPSPSTPSPVAPHRRPGPTGATAGL